VQIFEYSLVALALILDPQRPSFRMPRLPERFPA
jgi:hypothetical protein